MNTSKVGKKINIPNNINQLTKQLQKLIDSGQLDGVTIHIPFKQNPDAGRCAKLEFKLQAVSNE